MEALSTAFALGTDVQVLSLDAPPELRRGAVDIVEERTEGTRRLVQLR